MADKITEGNTLAIGLEYESLENKIKTAYIKIPSPRSNLTEQQIRTVALQLISGDGAILRDAEGDAFDSDTAIATAYTEYEKKTEYDLGLD